MDITGVRHLKIFVSDLARSREWYEKVFRLEHDTSFQDEDGVIRGMTFRLPGTSLQLALRENPTLAKALNDADPFALATTREALDAWDGHLDELEIPHTPVLETGSGHALGFRDPDGMQIRLYAHDEKARASRGDVVQVGKIDADKLIKRR
jgi:catechol 2,3-dioxygenase-like lactoylglutathione lyase family enzyme